MQLLNITKFGYNLFLFFQRLRFFLKFFICWSFSPCLNVLIFDFERTLVVDLISNMCAQGHTVAEDAIFFIRALGLFELAIAPDKRWIIFLTRIFLLLTGVVFALLWVEAWQRLLVGPRIVLLWIIDSLTDKSCTIFVEHQIIPIQRRN